MADILSLRGGINWRLPAYALPEDQCVYLQNLRFKDAFIESILGTRRYINSAISGSNPVTGIFPYYNSDTDGFELLIASGSTVYKRNPATMALTSIKSGLVPNKLFSSVIRHNVMYLPSESDGLSKYLGGNQIETVGGGGTAPGNFRQILWMKEVDRMFGIGKQAITGQIRWSNGSNPEIWNATNIDRMKFQDGEIDEGAEILYGKLIIFNTYSIWIYYVSGNPENWKLEQAPTTVGCRAFKTIKKVGNEIWFLGDSPRTGIGIYAFNGSTVRLLTDDVTPLLERINKERIGDCVAELHDDLYTFSFPLDFANENNISIDLDTVNVKEDGTPAIYGPHTFGFFSSAVLNTRNNSGELLFGDPSDGFVYEQRGTTLKSNNDADGSLLQHRFLSAIHNDGDWDTMKRFDNCGLYFVPRGYFQTRFRVYLSYGTYAREYPFYPSAAYGYIAGDYNAFENPIFGSPELYQHEQRLGRDKRGVSIQLELINDTTANRLAFQGYYYNSKKLHKTRRAYIYAT